MDQSIVQVPALSDDERARRKDAVDYARASVRLEGFVLDGAAETVFACYVNGEITRPELNEAVQKLASAYGE